MQKEDYLYLKRYDRPTSTLCTLQILASIHCGHPGIAAEVWDPKCDGFMLAFYDLDR